MIASRTGILDAVRPANDGGFAVARLEGAQ
jgi:hypothetical protein